MNTKKLDLNLLITLEVLLEEKNVTKAASRLHLSQPAVSAQLSRLRDLFDDQLLLPTQRGMLPTAKAIELSLPLRTALDQVRDTFTSHQQFNPKQEKRTFTVACTDYIQSVFGLLITKELKTQAPNTKIAFQVLEPNTLENKMITGEIDLALMTPQSAPVALRSTSLFNEHYVLVGRADHPNIKDKMSIDDYLQLEHVVVSLNQNSFLTEVDQVLKGLDYSRKVALFVTSFLVIPEIVKNSDFVALVPQRLVAGRTDLKVITSPIALPSFSVGLVWHDRTHRHNAHSWIRELISTVILR